MIQRLEFLSQPAQQLQYLGQRPAQALLPAILSPSLVKASHSQTPPPGLPTPIGTPRPEPGSPGLPRCSDLTNATRN